MNYWSDGFQTKGMSYSRSFYYQGEPIYPGIASSNRVVISNTATVKAERITFIPPKSYCSFSQFYLCPIEFFNFNPIYAVGIYYIAESLQ
jgi:hypothetical protein